MAGAVVLALDDHTTLEVPSELLTLDQSLTIRKKAQQIVAPLTKTGVDVLYFKNEAEVTLSIHKADVAAYELPGSEEVPLLDQGYLFGRHRWVERMDGRET
jgi:hypothetical protein